MRIAAFYCYRCLQHKIFHRSTKRSDLVIQPFSLHDNTIINIGQRVLKLSGTVLIHHVYRQWQDARDFYAARPKLFLMSGIRLRKLFCVALRAH